MTSLDNFLANVPLLHSWDGGKTWSTGGFVEEHLRPLSAMIKSRLPAGMHIAETGMGASTILFLLHRPSHLLSIDPSPKIAERIVFYCREHGVNTDSWRPIHSRSETALTKLWEGYARKFDLVLIDGDHGWPAVFIDFHFLNQMLKVGGLLIVDDIQLHSVGELGRFLREEPSFRQVLDIGKALVFEKVDDSPARGWKAQPYILRNSVPNGHRSKGLLYRWFTASGRKR